MEEIFKDIEGYEEYQISNFGRVKSLNYNRTGKEKILKSYSNTDGYLQVDLYKQGKRKGFKIHRLVADTFLDNPNNYEEVNHIDEDKTNNHVTNLEWCTHFYNMNYGTRTDRAKDKQKIAQCKKVLCITTNTIYNSIKEASQILNISSSNICYCCNGKRKTCGGLKWKYVS